MLTLFKLLSKQFIITTCYLALLFLCSSCATVKPWQKEILAKPEMSLEPSSVLVHNFKQEEYASREASQGGYSVGGGGCGCD